MGLGLAALGGLAKGIGQGMQYADYMEEKKAEQALREKQFALNEQIANQKIAAARDEQEARDNQKAIDQKIADSWKAGQVDNNAAAVTYTNPNGEQKTAYQPDQQTAENAAQQQRLEENAQPVAPEVPSNPMVTTATSVRDFAGNRKLFTGLNAAADAKAFADQNQPGSYAHFTALRGQLASMLGGQKAADDYLNRAKEAQKEGVFETLLALKSKNPDVAAAKKIFNSTGTYRMADNEEFAPDIGADGKPTGKWNVVQTQPDGSTKIAIPDVETFASDRIRGAQGVIDDIKARNAAKLKLQEKIAEEQAKGHVIPAGATFSPGVGDPRKPVTNYDTLVWSGNYNPDGSPEMVRSTKGGAGGAGGGAQAKTPDIIEKTLKGNESLIAPASAISESLQARYPQLRENPAAAHNIAINAVQGKNMEVTFNPSTGMFERHYNDVATKDEKGNTVPGYFGGQKVQIDSQIYRPNGVISKDQATAAINEWAKRDPDGFKKFAPAATKEGLAKLDTDLKGAWQQMQDRAKTEMDAAKKAQQDAVAAGDQKAAAAAIDKQREIQAKLVKYKDDVDSQAMNIAMVRDFYKPTADGKGNNAPPPNKVSATEMLSQNWIGAAVPRDAVERVAAGEAQAKARADQAKAAETARLESEKQARAEIAGLTPEVIASIADINKVRELYDKYGSVLDDSQVAAMQRRMNVLVRQSQFKRGAGGLYAQPRQ